MNKVKALLIGSRPWSFPMTLLSVAVGTLLAAETGEFHPVNFVIVALGMILFHGATNLVNDYFDYKSGVDSEDSPTAKYRSQPLVENWVEPEELLVYCSLAYLAVAVIGGYLTYSSGPMVLVLGFIGFAASYLYTGGSVEYKYLGWGELSVFLVWGPLMVSGSYYVQAGGFSLKPLLISIPLGLLVALVLLANNLRDRDYDREAGVETVATLLDKEDALILYFLLIVAVYSNLGYLVLGGVLGLWGLLGFLSFPMAYRLIRTFFEAIPDDADARTARLEVAFAGLLTVSLIFETVL
ncbi:MAG: 1,4-dihydroxy-2-naphthoate octaprenyltransferase [Candidatus Bipolaricaulota bacterium]|nr:1,4-dihydroxy-2-naphthoate octaprenyltransferase [Candidatus Bipolaricaulota bacterium]MBS3792391.1 1,4-dihydroxy-2-naphthoate octaprenyltransferase [Candidatus Bipolaricaulota bacterium]